MDAALRPLPATPPAAAARDDLFARLALPEVVQRAPRADDPARWRRARVGGIERRFAQPLTFTPYASVRPCSARCRFCSETLRPVHGGTAAASLRPGPRYFAQLRVALAQLRGLPLACSLSGLEMSDDAPWFRELLHTLRAAGADGPRIDGSVLYSNGAGFAGRDGEALRQALRDFGLGWIELSRHHDDARSNDAIMRFRAGEAIADAGVFAATARRLAATVELRLVCILQQGGIADADGVERYLRWASALGARTVIFRELSRLGDDYRATGSRRYIDNARVPLEPLLADCLAAPWWHRLQPRRRTVGYYFWNVQMRTPDGVDVIFETSDYEAMHAMHATGDIWKLVFFADGRLCSGWEPDRDVLLDTRAGAALSPPAGEGATA